MDLRGLYVHIPFCVRKCAYCDFYSLPDRLDFIDAYVDALLLEAEGFGGLSFHTLYLGGGTPSLLGAGGVSRLAEGLRRRFDMSRMEEASIEVNPESAGADLLRAAVATGLDRVSIGVQSLSEYELKAVGRVHDPVQAVQAVRLSRQAGFRSISADAIIGLPGQTWETLRLTLEGLLGEGIVHLSVYCLSVEPGTPLHTNPPEDLPSDDQQAGLFEQARDLLETRGFVHYEISNFALPGHQRRHNLNYWRGGEYLGLGAGASSHLHGRRFKSGDDLDAYLRQPGGLVEQVEELGGAEKAAEEAMLRLRLLSEGLAVEDMAGRYGPNALAGLLSRLDEMAGEGLLTFDGSAYRLPRSRVLTSNRIFARVLGAV